MLVFAVCTQVTLYIQVAQMFITKNAQGVSILAYSLLTAGQLLWLAYAIWIAKHRNWPVAISSILSAIACILIITACALFGTSAI